MAAVTQVRILVTAYNDDIFIINVLTFTYIDGHQKRGLNRDLNPGPLAPKARIIPLDH